SRRKPARPVSRRHPNRPAVEELEPRLTPAEVGLNDFRISFEAGAPNPFDTVPVVAYNSRDNQYLVVWAGDDIHTAKLKIFGQRLNAATGALIGGAIRISDMGPDSDLDFDAVTPAVAYNPTNNEYLVVWCGADNIAPLVKDEFEIFGQRLNAATGAEVGANDF